MMHRKALCVWFLECGVGVAGSGWVGGGGQDEVDCLNIFLAWKVLCEVERALQFRSPFIFL